MKNREDRGGVNGPRLMGWFHKIKISNQIALMYGLIFVVLVFIISIFIIANIAGSYLSYYQRELQRMGEVVVAYIEETGDTSYHRIMELINDPAVRMRIADMPPEVVEQSDDYFDPRGGMKGRGPLPGVFDQRPGGIMSKYLSSIHIATYEGRSFAVILERGPDAEMQVAKTSSIFFVGINLFGIAGAVFAGRYMSKKILAPIVAITKTAERIGVEDLSRRIEFFGPDDEIKILADTFNEMIGRLEVAFDKQTQFISDASHELRTPISVIQGYANLIDRWGKDDPAILQESIDSIITETEHMSMLVKKLLFLAKNEHSKKLEGKKPILLNEIAGEVVKEINVLEVSHDIILIEEDDVYVNGDFDLLKQMIWTFLENSIKYTVKEKGEITIGIYRDDAHGHISIKDNGIGISEGDIPLIFERFYRADKSRSKEVPGTGIGLSIADWIIKNHDGKTEVKSALDYGTEIIVSLPLLKEYDILTEEK